MKGDLVRSQRLGIGRVEETSGFGEGQRCAVYFARSDRVASVPKGDLESLSGAEAAAYELVRLAARELREEESSKIKLHERWRGGELVFKPGSAELASKSVPVDAFFHKIVMVRDRLRLLEQQINAHKGLLDDEKVDLQQYITRAYGSLTTFNFLFGDKADWFVGQKGEK
ncbi:MAG: hypothetical protein HZB55_18570 [Deltaproteobacteria bacterium]|nr:hypothetical protein [Deltaproteobacteria bacterium]